jgi:hypothetical protein
MTWNTGAPWLFLLLVALAIEIIAAETHRRTLSQQVWAAAARPVWHWLLPVLTVIGFVILFVHFYAGLWMP